MGSLSDRIGSGGLPVVSASLSLCRGGRSGPDRARYPDRETQKHLRHALGDAYSITPSLSASSGETLRQLALAGAGIVCLADFMTRADRARGELVQLLLPYTVEVRQPIHGVYYRNTALASRIACFLDYLAGQLLEA